MCARHLLFRARAVGPPFDSSQDNRDAIDGRVVREGWGKLHIVRE